MHLARWQAHFRRLGTFRSHEAVSLQCRKLSGNSGEASHRVVFSGIQPTGIPHLGNYLGAIQNWVQLQDAAHPQDQMIYCIVGYHAITLPQEPRRLAEERLNMLASFIACGIDPERSIIFSQDQVPEHTELAWIFNCITPVGKLFRMTTWKSKLAVVRNVPGDEDIETSQLNLGLLSYPVLQAADILLYRGTHVPVGDDQTQHLELARDIAQHFNFQFGGNYFPSPAQLKTPVSRVLSLRDPNQKMSKSAPSEQSRILITDMPNVITKKIRSAVVDSDWSIQYDPDKRPGLSNLLSILHACCPTIADDATSLSKLYDGKGHASLKGDVADAVIAKLLPIRAEYERLKADEGYLRRVAKEGDDRARGIAKRTMADIKHAIGLSPL